MLFSPLYYRDSLNRDHFPAFLDARFSEREREKRKTRRANTTFQEINSSPGEEEGGQTKLGGRNRPRLSPRLELTRNYAILRFSRQILSTVRVGMRVVARGKTLFLTLGYPLIGELHWTKTTLPSHFLRHFSISLLT